jgi:hypothetical protein
VLYLHCFQSIFFHGLPPCRWQTRICHFCAHSSTHNLELLLTDLNPRLSLLWIAMASSSCKISDSSVVTRSRTSGVLTKRTNLQRIHIRMVPPRNATRSCFRYRRQPFHSASCKPWCIESWAWFERDRVSSFHNLILSSLQVCQEWFQQTWC